MQLQLIREIESEFSKCEQYEENHIKWISYVKPSVILLYVFIYLLSVNTYIKTDHYWTEKDCAKKLVGMNVKI